MTNYASAKTVPNNQQKGAKIIKVPLKDQSGRYKLGPARRPSIKHDNGFLDQFPKREPTASEKLALLKWRAKLNGAKILRPDLIDATEAYEHFLDGTGKNRRINYAKYLQNDKSGIKTLKTVINDFKSHSEVIGQHRTTFDITSEMYPVGSDPMLLPYPDTENWQKAIGAHILWVSASNEISFDTKKGKDVYIASMILHMEDMYNFNPGANDIATGIPDSENGVFEVTGLGKQYLSFAEVPIQIQWYEGE